jgi:membrane protein implicated in regulation of membrane protease activity
MIYKGGTIMILTDVITQWWFWLIVWGLVLVIAVIVEAATEQLVSIWFALGALIAAILACFDVAWYIQIVVFTAVSLATLVAVKVILVKDRQKNSSTRTNTDSLIGSEIVVTKAINGLDEPGQGKNRDVIWTLESDERIEEGEKVIVSSIKGNRLVVKKIK